LISSTFALRQIRSPDDSSCNEIPLKVSFKAGFRPCIHPIANGQPREGELGKHPSYRTPEMLFSGLIQFANLMALANPTLFMVTE